ncbi:MAG: transglycosylase domain-containing protein [Alphaproteobacteria bacterium]
MPDIEDAINSTRKPAINIIAANGDTITTYGQIYGDTITVKDVSPYLIQAIIATEDRKFFSHFGIDPLGIARAMLSNIRHLSFRQGGSTITQQVAKNLFLSNEKTFKRKAKELLISLWLEKNFSKEQILNIYLNRVYLGAGVYGMEAASQRYFNNSVRDASLFQSAVLAGLLKAPSRYNPVYSLDKAEDRATQVLANMVNVGFITKNEAETAIQNKSEIINPYRVAGARHFADWIYNVEMEENHIDTTEDINVFTTLNPEIQSIAEETLERIIADNKGTKNVSDGAVIILNKKGEVITMVGGINYSKSQFNLATQSLRQPGSTFKPFVYLTALENGFSPSSILTDEAITIDGWSPNNYSNEHYGKVSLTEALVKSINTIPVILSEKIGRDKVIKNAQKLGITTPILNVPALALGANGTNLWDMTKAYSVFANDGLKVEPYGINEVYSREGFNLFKHKYNAPKRVVPKIEIDDLDLMLKKAVEKGTGKRAKLKNAAARGKTGTTQNNRDAWFIGYASDYICGVWVGNVDDSPMKNVTGGNLPAQIFKEIMDKVISD